MIDVPAGKVLVLTRMYGKPIPPERLAAGDFLAREGERGIVAEVLRPGKYRINPYAYTWKLEDAVEVGAGEVGVLTLKVGKDPKIRTSCRPTPSAAHTSSRRAFAASRTSRCPAAPITSTLSWNPSCRWIHGLIRRSSRTLNFPPKTAFTSSRTFW